MTTDEGSRQAVLPSAFERWQLVLEPGAEWPTAAGEWADALVQVERGCVEVICRAGDHRTFVAGDMLALGWLPLRTLRNLGPTEARLVAVRRRGDLPTSSSLHVIRGDAPVKFQTTILSGGGNTTGIPVPPDVMEALAGGRRPAVTVALRGHSYRSTVATVDGRPMISLSAENRTAAGVSAGDEVEVEVELDTAPRTVDVPADLASALDADSEARRTFDALSYSNKSWHVLQVNGAKTDDTRLRRIAKSVSTLHDGRAR